MWNPVYRLYGIEVCAPLGLYNEYMKYMYVGVVVNDYADHDINSSQWSMFRGVTSAETKCQQWCRICHTMVRIRNILRNTGVLSTTDVHIWETTISGQESFSSQWWRVPSSSEKLLGLYKQNKYGGSYVQVAKKARTKPISRKRKIWEERDYATNLFRQKNH